MALARMARRLGVFLNGRQVGWFGHEASGAVDFLYAPDWLGWEHAMPVSLSLPLRESRYIGAPVLAVFDGLLPDNDGLRRRLAERVGAEGVDAYSLLAAIGRDCVGALQFLPEGVEPGPVGQVEGEPIGEEDIARTLANLGRSPLGLERDQEFRISLAGAQEKTALLHWRGKWYRPSGTTPTTHILKPQIGQLPNGLDLSNSVENEYLCLALARALGLEAAAAKIARFGDRTVLVVERFDRLWAPGGRLLRVPQEDCCQALSVPWTRKYESDGGPGIPTILRLLAGSDVPAKDQADFLKANILFWLLGATDGHAKNFSLFLGFGGGYRLAPLYDVISAEPSLTAHRIRYNQMKLAMAVGSNRHYGVREIEPRHFIESAQKGGMGRKAAVAVLNELRDKGPEALRTVEAELPAGFPPAVWEAVANAFARRLPGIPAALT